MNFERIDMLRTQIEIYGFDGAVMIPGPTLFYLTGQSFHLMERPVVLIVPREKTPVVILPEMESDRLEAAGTALNVFSYGEDDASRSAAFEQATAMIGFDQRLIAIEPLIFRYLEFDLLSSSAPRWEFQSGVELFTALREKKGPSEIEAMRKAVDIAETALIAALPLIKIGMSEHDLAAELVVQLLRAGSEPELPFQPIVASGPNSALPHSTPTERMLAPGDVLILDWGARSNGYISDITRTFAVGDVDPELNLIHQIVLEANAAGRAAARPGATCHAVDQAARQVIQEAGYGEYFIHRTGHGIGLEAHEPPNIRSGEMYALEPGMTFTIEPGIYMLGSAGVRIEDNLLITNDGQETLTSLDRTLDVVG